MATEKVGDCGCKLERRADGALMMVDCPLHAAALDLLYACEEHIKHIDSLPDDTEKCRILKMSLNNRSGELIRLAVKMARGE